MAYALAFFLPITLAFLLQVLRNWRFGVYLGFLWLLSGDTLRKLIPGQPPSLILVGDFIFLLTYFSFFAWSIVSRKKIWTPPFTLSLFALVFFVITEVLNPALPSFLIGLIGLRNFIWFIPLIFLGHAFFEDWAEAKKILKKFVYIAIPFFIFALIPILNISQSPIFLPFETAHQAHSFTFGNINEVPKIPSFFGSDQRYGMISMLWFFLGIGLRASLKKIQEKQKLLFLSILSALGGVILSGSRSALVLTVFGILLLFFFSKRTVIKNTVRFFSWQKLFLTMTAIILTLLVLYGLGVAAGISGLVGFTHVFNSRIPAFFKEATYLISDATLFGHGTGTLSQGLEEVGQFGSALQGAAYKGGETGVKRILFELGIVGLLLFYFFWAQLLASMKKLWEKTQELKLCEVALAVFVFVTLVLVRFTFVHHQVLGDSAVLASVWFFIGVFFKLTERQKEPLR